MAQNVVVYQPGQRIGDSGAELTVELVNAPAGAGKTWGLCVQLNRDFWQGVDKWQRDPTTPGMRVIISCPTKELIDQYKEMLVKAGLPNRNVIKDIHSDTGSATVRVQLREYFRRLHLAREHPAILLCTHAAMAMERPDEFELDDDGNEVTIWNPEDWTLCWDEAPEMLQFEEMIAPFEHRIWSQYMRVVPFGANLYRVLPALDFPDWYMSVNDKIPTPKDLLRVMGRNRPYDQHREPSKVLCAAVANPHKLVLVRPDEWDQLVSRGPKGGEGWLEGHLNVMIVADPQAYGVYRRVIIMGARVKDTMACILWRALWDTKFVDHPLMKELPQRHTNGKRLRIHYIFEERATRTFMAKKGTGFKTMFLECAAAVARDIEPKKMDNAIWAAPRPREDSLHGVKSEFFRGIRTALAHRGIKLKGNHYQSSLRLPGKSFGLNKFLKRHVVVLLSVLHFTPEQHEMLQSIGLSDEQIDRAFQFNANYQDALRCNLRVTEASPNIGEKGDLEAVAPVGTVHVYVPDRASAEDLAGDFEGCRIERLPDSLIPAEEPKKRFDSRAERQRDYRQRKKLANMLSQQQRDKVQERRHEGDFDE